MTSRIINFLRGSATDYLARKLTELQNLPDHQLERCHNVVQWMFPTDIPSKFYQDAPVLTPEDIETIQNEMLDRLADLETQLQVTQIALVAHQETNDEHEYRIRELENNLPSNDTMM